MWLRLYTDTRDDPKVQRLPDAMFKHWVNLLCLAKEGGGLLPPIEDIAYKLKISDAEAQSLTEELVKRKLLDSDGKNLSPHNWHKRQFESDNSTERVKRFRNVSETSPDTEQIQSRTEPETEQSRGGSGENPSPASRAKPRSARAPVLADDAWLGKLQKNPAYSMLNVRHCYQRMLAWCEVNGKLPSPRRFINWLNKEDKPMTAKASPPKTGAAYVGSQQPKAAPVADPKVIEAQMAGYIEELIELEDFIHLGHEYDNIIGRGGAKADWEIRLFAWYELHKDEPQSPEKVAQLKTRIDALVPQGGRK